MKFALLPFDGEVTDKDEIIRITNDYLMKMLKDYNNIKVHTFEVNGKWYSKVSCDE